jgi:hypothetical protein
MVYEVRLRGEDRWDGSLPALIQVLVAAARLSWLFFSRGVACQLKSATGDQIVFGTTRGARDGGCDGSPLSGQSENMKEVRIAL